MTREGAQTSRWIATRSGEVGRLDGPTAEAGRQRRRRRLLYELPHEEVQRLAGVHEAMARERRAQLDIVLEREGRACVGLGEDLVEQVAPVGADIDLELCCRALQPRPRDDSVAVAPQSERPLGLAALVLPEAPRDVPDVPRRARPEQTTLLESELLHPCDDLRCESHV